MAELDRGAVRARAGAGLDVARAGGGKAGRRPKLSAQQRAAIVEEVLSSRQTAAEMARRYEVSEATAGRVMAAHRAMAEVSEGSRPDPGGSGQDDRITGVLPLAALNERLTIVGTSGSGKTYAAKGLGVRLMAQGACVCVVDPLGVW